MTTFKAKVTVLDQVECEELQIEAKDGFPLAATLYPGGSKFVVMAPATGVLRRFYRHLAAYLQSWGATVVCFDFRGTGGSRPKSLRGFEAKFSEWGLLDLAGVLRWVREKHRPEQLFIVGHSAGGQVAALADEPVDGMVTLSSQSGYWKYQGANQKYAVCFYMYVVFPILSHLFGYMPWSKLGNAEDIPKGVALEWARWCRDPHYLHGDESLPLELYGRFQAPVLAYSIEDDAWGSKRSVDAMMQYYPNVERRHLVVERPLGHFGYFKAGHEDLWGEITEFFESISFSSSASSSL